jgi:hypothetical protein
MSSSFIVNGTAVAPFLPAPSQPVAESAAQLSTLQDLLDIIRNCGDKNLPMLRTTAVRLSEFKNQSIGQLSIEALVDIRLHFKAYLKERRYTDNSVRTYVQNAQRLLRRAEELGWVSEKLSVEEAWKPFFAALEGKPRAYKKVIAFAIRQGRMPEDFADADLDAWGDSMLRAGRQYRTVRMGKWNFRKALSQAGLVLPNLTAGSYRTAYGVRTPDLPEPLRSEVGDLLVWKQARFAKGRPQWTRHRPVSAKLLEKVICRLFGFARDIGNFDDITNLSALFREEVVSAFIEWNLNVRNLSRSSLLRLTMIYGALRHHPKYKTNDYHWFSTLFDEVPEDDQSLIQERKAKKFVPHAILRTIPESIRSARLKLEADSVKASWLAHDELMIEWLTVLPWRQRNIRECRIGSPETANVFFAPLPALVHVAKPNWVDDALKIDPQQSFWQFYFRDNETKTGQVRGVLPRRLIPLLEKYLHEHRHRVVGERDPGTLFINRDGGAMDERIVTNHVAEITLKHTGRRMTPHLFRDAFAYAYLESHPEDYLTLSKILWHGSVKYTLSVYGRNFDESNGARRIDEWLGPRSEMN